MKVINQSAILEFVTPDALQLIERAGRTCYRSEEKITNTSAARFVKMLLDRGHLSVLEHAVATIRFVTDRGVTHELVRHRLAAYSQESTRYCNYGGQDMEFVIPEDAVGSPMLESAEFYVWKQAMKDAERVYKDLLAFGVSPQVARSVLPNSLKTEIVMTANFREWRHVFKMRLDKAAHPSMRRLMRLAEVHLHALYPEVFTEPY